MYEAMARRYRPHTFDDVVGQEHVAQTLKNSINSQRVAHAYLFCGPHGCGKTSMARIFACALVCENGPTDVPCGKCAICKDVLKGQDVDVQEIDGASNNGVEQVRALREQAGYIPSRARYKIYIIDEVHMLSVAAFNALLKTLEEPPAHVKFILATTDPHKVLGTILSRCQRFDFRLVPPVKMSAYLKKLVEKESAQITDDALAAVAAFSGGSMRDGLVLLDQLVSFSSSQVTREDVERVRGVAGAESVAGIYEAVASHDVIRALQIVDSVSALGTNVGDFLDQLIAFGRDLMLVAATGSDDGISAYGPARSILLELSSAVSLEQTLLMLDVFTQARVRVRSKALTNQLIPLEMAVSRLAGLESLNPVNDLVERLSAYASGAPIPEIGLPLIQKKDDVGKIDGKFKAPAAQKPESACDVDEVQLASSMKTDSEGTQRIEVEINQKETGDNKVPWSDADDVEKLSDQPVKGYVPANPQIGVSDSEVSVNSVDIDGNHQSGSVDYGCNSSDLPINTDIKKEISVQTDIDLQDLWQNILHALNLISKADAPFLGDVYIDRIEQDKLYLSVPGGGNFIFEQLEDSHRKQRIAESAGEVLGYDVEIHLVMRESVDSSRNEPVPGERGDNLVPSFESPVHKMREAERERGVKVILENFEGSITNIEDA